MYKALTQPPGLMVICKRDSLIAQFVDKTEQLIFKGYYISFRNAANEQQSFHM